LNVTSQMRGLDLTGSSKATALWYDAPGSAVLREEQIRGRDTESSTPLALIRTQWSGISRGTERLVISGKIPPSEYERMRSPFQSGHFPFPVKYGYCAAGVVEDGPPEFIGKRIFALHPHQDRFVIPVQHLMLVPEALPLRRAALAANMETALNAIWDSGAGPGDNIIVMGAGIVGLLITYLCAGLPGAEVTAVDAMQSRAEVIKTFGARFLTAEAWNRQLAERNRSPIVSPGADIVFHTSTTQQGLASAMASVGFEGRIIEMDRFWCPWVEHFTASGCN
jgi:NADPH:quinone reductase-like Zn-dependent oxidoreductase